MKSEFRIKTRELKRGIYENLAGKFSLIGVIAGD